MDDLKQVLQMQQKNKNVNGISSESRKKVNNFLTNIIVEEDLPEEYKGYLTFAVISNSIELLADDEDEENDESGMKRNENVEIRVKRKFEMFRHFMYEIIDAKKHNNNEKIEEIKNKFIDSLGGKYTSKKINIGNKEISLEELIRNNTDCMATFFLNNNKFVSKSKYPSVESLRMIGNYVVKQTTLPQKYKNFTDFVLDVYKKIGNDVKKIGSLEKKQKEVDKMIKYNKEDTKNNTKTLVLSGASVLGAIAVTCCPILVIPAVLGFMFSQNKNSFLGKTINKIVDLGKGAFSFVDESFRKKSEEQFKKNEKEINEMIKSYIKGVDDRNEKMMKNLKDSGVSYLNKNGGDIFLKDIEDASGLVKYVIQNNKEKLVDDAIFNPEHNPAQAMSK